MADIFISYTKHEPGPTRQLAAVLEARGYAVWWDTELIGGVDFREAILKQIDTALAVIVIWTPASVTSEWVLMEAELGLRSKKLVPLRAQSVDYARIPAQFQTLHTDSIDDTERVVNALTALGVLPLDIRASVLQFRGEYEDDDDLDGFTVDCQYDEGDAARFVVAYTKLITRKPGNAAAYNNRGLAYTELGDYALAIADFSKALMLTTDMREYVFQHRGNAYRAAGQFDRAITDYETAMKIADPGPSLYLDRGTAFEQKGDVERALQDYNKAIELHAEHTQALVRRGELLEKAGNSTRAIKDFRRALVVDPQCQAAKAGLKRLNA